MSGKIEAWAFCPVCNKGFLSQHGVDAHQRIHNKERPQLYTQAQLDEAVDQQAELLSDLSAWISYRLEYVKQRAGRIPPTFTDGYSYVEIPEWEMRQKLAALEAARQDGAKEEEIK